MIKGYRRTERNKTMKITRPEHNYSILFHEDDTLFLIVKTEDSILEFDGGNGNLIIASSFEDFDYDEEFRMTLPDAINSAREFFKDWGVDANATEAIIKDLTPWFAKYAISEEEKIKDDIWELEEIIAFRRDSIARKMRYIEEENGIIDEARRRIDTYAREAAKLDVEIKGYEKAIADLKASLK